MEVDTNQGGVVTSAGASQPAVLLKNVSRVDIEAARLSAPAKRTADQIDSTEGVLGNAELEHSLAKASAAKR